MMQFISGRFERPIVHIVLVLSACLLLSSCAAKGEPVTQPAVPDKQQQIAIIKAARAKIRDLSVISTSTQIRGRKDDAVTHSRITCVIKGERIYLDNLFGFDEEPMTARRINGFDGKQTTMIQQDGRAVIMSGRSSELRLLNIAFFEINMLDIASDQPGDLLATLGSRNAALRPAMEMLQGQACCVVDVILPQMKGPSETIWLDVNRGYLPVRHIIYGTKGPRFQYDIEKASKVSDGLWLATRGHKQVFPNGQNDPYVPEVIEIVMNVESNPNGPNIVVNQNIADDLFDLPAHFLPGTVVLDQVAGKEWTVGFGAFKAPALRPTTHPMHDAGADSTEH